MIPTTAVNPISKLRLVDDDLYKRAVEAVAHARRGQVNCAAELARGKTNGSSTLSPECEKLKVLLVEIDDFLKELSALSSNPETVEDYLWLCDTAVRWEHVFSSMLNLPKSVPIYQPPASLLPPLPAGDALSHEELDNWVEKCSQVVWAYRLKKTRRYQSTFEEKLSDWHQAEVFLASDILDGTLNFARRISSESYWRLEKVWLFEVRQLLAYFEWEKNGGKPFDPDATTYYLTACAHIRDKLLAANMKTPATKFGEAKMYLEEHYLTDGNKLDYDKLRRADAHNIIAIKADRISKMTKPGDDEQNWRAAETYVKLFYENIIPAVMTGNAENAEAVMKAFRLSFSSERSYHIINCFEMALAIYFLKPESVALTCPF